MLINKEEVLSFLPHKPPFLFVDTIESISVPDHIKTMKQEDIQTKHLVDSSIVAHFEVKEDLVILAGHFPGNPILPGVIQIEMMAQASAFVSIALNDMKVGKVNVETLLVSVERAKFRKPIYPGMKLKICSKLDKCRGTIASYSGEIYCNEEKVSEVSFLAKLVIKRGE